MNANTIIRAKDGNCYEVTERNSEFVSAFPAGGGFHCVIPLSEIAEDPAVYEYNWKLVPLGFDDYVCDGYCDPDDRWNGWLQPMLDRANVERLVKWQENARSLGSTISARLDGEVLVIRDDEQDESEATVSIHPQSFEGADVQVWNLGLIGWAWDRVEKDEPGDRCTIICNLPDGHHGPCSKEN